MDVWISTAIARPLKPEDIEAQCKAAGYSTSAFCDAFARRVVERYMSGNLSWPDGDAAMNNISRLMTMHCGESYPDFGWSVYLAFDAGEYQKPGGDAVTKPLLFALDDKHSA